MEDNVVAAQDADEHATATTAEQTQVCTDCHRLLPTSAFYHENRRRPDGTAWVAVRRQCPQCMYNRRRASGTDATKYRQAAQRKQSVSADDRRYKHATSEAGYHFDTRFVRRLMRIARTLDREKWRSLITLTHVDNQQLSAAGLTDSDVQILRKAQATNDESMLHFILDEPIAAKELVRIRPYVPEQPESEPAPAPTRIEAEAEAVVAPDVSEALLSDMDIEAAAEMIVHSKSIISELRERIQTTLDLLRQQQADLDSALADRTAAISMLRRA